MIESVIVAGLGGFLGTALRYLTGKFAHRYLPSPFPWGTFIVNVVGCFIIGIFVGLAARSELSSRMNVFLITGFCGGLTTFSSFADDIYLLIKGRHWGHFVLYVGLSILLGILLVWAGRSLVLH